MTTLDAAGNWPPERALVRALVQRGHDVRVLSDASHAAEIAAIGARFLPYEAALRRDPTQRHDESPQEEMVRVLRTVFLNTAYADALLAEVQREAPDALLVDQMLLMAAAAAERTAIPTVSLWHTVLFARAGAGAGPPAALFEQLNGFREHLGIAPVPQRWPVLGWPDAILACTHEAFDAVPLDRPAQLHYVGPLACAEAPPTADGSYAATDDARPLVLISYSTSFQNQLSTLQRVADAVGQLPVRALLTLGAAISADELSLPANVRAERFIPHAAVLPHASLVVTHAGHGTVMAAVTAGVPLVCTPMGRDQHAVSACVERCGLGVVLPMTAATDELRRAIGTAVADEELQRRARAFAADLDVEAGVRKAISVLESVAATRRA